jgi:hypothetical protein
MVSFESPIGPFVVFEIVLVIFSITCFAVAFKLWKKAEAAKIPRITTGTNCRYLDPLCDELVCYCGNRK